jgi:hypothetical protein
MESADATLGCEELFSFFHPSLSLLQNFRRPLILNELGFQKFLKVAV